MILLKIGLKHLSYLGEIRHWANLKIGKDGEYYWVTGFTEEQIDHVDVQSIPFKETYTVKDNKLYPFGANLPISKAPSLLWSPIGKGFPVSLPDFNHNYFGVGDKINIKLVPNEKPSEVTAIVISISRLEQYVVSAPAVRLKNLKWVIIHNSSALVIGSPIPSIDGSAFWASCNSILPAGFDFELPILSKSIGKKLDPDNQNWIIWDKDSKYSLIQKSELMPLTRSSLRLTKRLITL